MPHTGQASVARYRWHQQIKALSGGQGWMDLPLLVTSSGPYNFFGNEWKAGIYTQRIMCAGQGDYY